MGDWAGKLWRGGGLFGNKVWRGATSVPTYGGIAVGSQGTGIYSGYTLIDGDEFTSFTPVTLQDSSGRYFTTKPYADGARSATTAIKRGYDSDANHVGDQDSAMGVAGALSNAFVQSGSSLTFNAIAATAAQQLYTNGRTILTSMIHSGGFMHLTAPFIIEMEVVFPSGSIPAGWHPDPLWTKAAWPFTAGAGTGGKSVEHNYEGSSITQVASFVSVNTGDGSQTQTIAGLYNGQPHKLSLIETAASGQYYVDDSLKQTVNVDSTKAGPLYWLSTNHTYDQAWFGDSGVNLSAWAASATGAPYTVNWMRVWLPTAVASQTLMPAAQLGNVQVAFGAPLSMQLPTFSALWGTSADSDYVQFVPVDDFAPGRPSFASTLVGQFPAWVTWNNTTRILSGTPNDRPGRMHLVCGATKAGGSISYIARGTVDVGPNCAATYLFGTVGVPFSWAAYQALDCGNLLPKQSVSVSGLPSWATYTPPATTLPQPTNAGLVTGTPTAAGSTTLTCSVTNSVGQSITASPIIAIGNTPGFPVPAISGSSVIAVLDATNTGFADGSSLAAWNDPSGTGYVWTQPTSAAQPVVTANVFTGTDGVKRQGVRFTASALQYMLGPLTLAQRLCATGGAFTVYAIVLPVSTPAVAGRIIQSRLSTAATTDTYSLSLRNAQIQSVVGNTTTSVNSSSASAALLSKPTSLVSLQSIVSGTSINTRLAVNGTLQTASGNVNQADTFDRVAIGADVAGTGTTTQTLALDGYIGLIVIYTTAHTATQINQFLPIARAYFGSN